MWNEDDRLCVLLHGQVAGVCDPIDASCIDDGRQIFVRDIAGMYCGRCLLALLAHEYLLTRTKVQILTPEEHQRCYRMRVQ